MAENPTKKHAEAYVGAMVLMVDPDMGDTYPALVTRVLNADLGRVNLTAFPPGVTPYPVRQAVGFDAGAKEKGTWHWGEVPKRG